MHEKEILDNFQEPIVVIDKDKNIVYSNSAFDSYISYFSKNDIINLLKEILSIKYLEEGLSVKNYLITLNNSYLLVDVYPFEDMYIILLKDITRLVKLEEELKKEGTLTAVSKFLIQLFHDIKGPITGIKAATEYLKENPDELDLLDDIIYEVNKIQNYINQLSSLSKPLKLNLSYQNIHKLIDKVVKKYEKVYKNVKFIKLYDPSLPDIYVDKEKMTSVIENLVKNAIEAIDQKGEITIQTGISFDSVFSPRMNKVSIKIKDSGKGVPQEIVDKIFLPHFTTKESGSGVGLANAYNIVKSHKGILRYIGNSTFEILLPIRIEVESNNI
ncbi:putative nitrogen regulation protein NR(II) [Sulfurihydrogenibium azorense Az-Fu1]|uniref:histidine kinase n=1 Tax=Sulfurihydrogenibium azorense (strain DSM 15241 / OCM 825 / Az-Fu1) TaxID=204536 RepID=C1DUX6_SULAA|nr:ATP-binding protein [Sulfurihydrogenibium azorense]ACN99358.1 putative nitrogen regulation protein NR(II) [Sulfurihydrogenibium azorense Az-Fu1]